VRRGHVASAVEADHDLAGLGDAHAFAGLVTDEFRVTAETFDVAFGLGARAFEGGVSLLLLMLVGADAGQASGLVAIGRPGERKDRAKENERGPEK